MNNFNFTDYLMWAGDVIFAIWQLELIIRGEKLDEHPSAAQLSQQLGVWLFIWVAVGLFLSHWRLYSGAICLLVLLDVLHPIGFNKVSGQQTPSTRLEFGALAVFTVATYNFNPF